MPCDRGPLPQRSLSLRRTRRRTRKRTRKTKTERRCVLLHVWTLLALLLPVFLALLCLSLNQPSITSAKFAWDGSFDIPHPQDKEKDKKNDKEKDKETEKEKAPEEDQLQFSLKIQHGNFRNYS